MSYKLLDVKVWLCLPWSDLDAFSEVAVDSDISAPAALEEIVKAPGIRPNPDMNISTWLTQLMYTVYWCNLSIHLDLHLPFSVRSQYFFHSQISHPIFTVLLLGGYSQWVGEQKVTSIWWLRWPRIDSSLVSKQLKGHSLVALVEPV